MSAKKSKRRRHLWAALPGNFGGQTFREYCSVTSGRSITANDLYKAIKSKKGGK